MYFSKWESCRNEEEISDSHSLKLGWEYGGGAAVVLNIGRRPLVFQVDQ